jgi:hypothetical protein
MKARLMIAVAVVTVALASAASANAKEQGPIRVVAESGKVGWIRGDATRAWWTDLDYGNPSSCACDSPTAVGKFEQRLFGRARWTSHEDGSWPTGMLLIQSGHSAAWLYYPASRTTPPYLIAPGGLGSQHIRWDSWERVTPRMQRLIEAALKSGSISTYIRSDGFPTGWAIGGGLGAVLLVGLILGAWRRPDVPARLRRSRFRSAP